MCYELPALRHIAMKSIIRIRWRLIVSIVLLVLPALLLQWLSL